ncbi:MAG TPA: lipid II flippase MurJ, partial [Terriglobales bacterium]|nr:lipid II flippase MurJ [Terriglobales bacterium]
IAIYTRFLAEKRDADAQKTFSVIITVMTTVLAAGVVLAEIFAPQIERVIFPQFSAEQLRLCVFLTRILLPGQVFFYVGGVVSAVLLSRRLFLIPAFAPLLYNVFIILGGVLLSARLGIASLAVGALAGSFTGPFLINAVGAVRTGMRYFPSFEIGNPAFREWVRLSIPLMLGISLVTADDWILRYFASGGAGDITRLNYAKRLFAVPMAVLGQAAGQASLPFFARLFSEKRLQDFAETVSGAVYRISAASFLVSAWMMATALPLIDLVYRRGRFHFTDSRETALYFFWFALSLAFWSAQAIYSRGFYGAGNTLTPMVASTVVTVASLPVYWAMFHAFSVAGLAMASDIGIIANTVVIVVLLDRRGLVPAALLRWGELGKAAMTAVFAGAVSYKVAAIVWLNGSRRADLESLALGSITWAAAVAAGLWITRSQLLRDLRSRRPAESPAPEALSARAEP